MSLSQMRALFALYAAHGDAEGLRAALLLSTYETCCDVVEMLDGERIHEADCARSAQAVRP